MHPNVSLINNFPFPTLSSGSGMSSWILVWMRSRKKPFWLSPHPSPFLCLPSSLSGPMAPARPSPWRRLSSTSSARTTAGLWFPFYFGGDVLKALTSVKQSIWEISILRPERFRWNTALRLLSAVKSNPEVSSLHRQTVKIVMSSPVLDKEKEKVCSCSAIIY